MPFNPLRFGEAFNLAGIVPEPVSEPAPLDTSLGFFPQIQPLPRQVPFTERFILYGVIRRSFIEDFRLAGAIVKPFMDNATFSATMVKNINESCLLAGYILTEDISSEAWERLFEEIEE